VIFDDNKFGPTRRRNKKKISKFNTVRTIFRAFQNLTQLGQSLEHLTQQKLQIDSNIRETELALEELEKASPDTVVYKQIGGIMIKTERNKLLDEKKSDKETLNMRSSTLAQKIEITKNAFESNQKSLQADLQNQ